MKEISLDSPIWIAQLVSTENPIKRELKVELLNNLSSYVLVGVSTENPIKRELKDMMLGRRLRRILIVSTENPIKRELKEVSYFLFMA